MDKTVFSRDIPMDPGAVSGKYLIVIDNFGKVQEISLDQFGKSRIIFGKDPGQCDIVIPFEGVSRVHGKLKFDRNRVLFADLGSTNGTILDLDGYRTFLRRNEVYAELHNGSILRIQPPQSTAQKSVMLLYVDSKEKGVWRKLPIMTSKVTIGRDSNNDIVLKHPGVSRMHAVIKKEGNRFTIYDNNSMNGVIVNGLKLDRSRVLEEKDVISILGSTLIFTNGMIIYKNSARGISIEVNNVNKYVGKNKKKILDRVTCNIESNEFVAIIGGSGAGKSTLMNAINGYDAKIQGTIKYNGMDLRKNFSELKNLIGFVPQEDIIYENLTLRKMLYYTAKLKMPKDMSKKEINDRINQVLQMVELTEHQNTYIRKMSGGQKKRASIAVEMLADPSVFFLDEPTSGLDPGTEQKLMVTLNRLSKTQGKTIIMVTHTTQSLQLCDKVIFMGRDGRLCFAGTTEQAKMFFDTDDLVNIYNMITDDSLFWADQWRNCSMPAGMEQPRSEETNIANEIKKRKKGSSIGQLPVLISRYVELICNDIQRLGLLFVQPIAIALLLSLVAADGVFEIYNDTQSILFALSCAAIWIGLFNSIQEICKERSILKREYMGNLKLPFYTLSKFLVQTLIGLIQALLMSLLFVLLIGKPEEGILMNNAFLEIMVTVWITIEASMALGFIISAIVKSGDKAMTMAPFVLIVQLLFSGILFKLDGAGKYIAYATISKWSVESLCSSANLNDLPMKVQIPGAEREFEEIYEFAAGHLWGHWGILAGMVLLCAVVCTVALRRISKDGR